MEHLILFSVAALIILFGSVSKRLETTPLTPPMLFVLAGLLVGPGVLDLIDLPKDHHLIMLLTELTLVLVLFTDASRVDLSRLAKEHDLPLRMLGIGLPLCIFCGALAAIPLFPDFNIWTALVLGCVLAPTDAALGQAVVSSPLVPIRIRQTLNVESGLNDGFALPVLLFFLCLAVHMDMESQQNFLLVAMQQLSLGLVVGGGIGFLGGKLVNWAHRGQWMSHTFEGLSSLGLAVMGYAGAELVGGNGFIAAFCAGAALGNTLREPCEALISFGEAEGQLLALLTFLFFGAVMVPPALHVISLPVLIYAVLSLTVVRMLPVGLSLMGTGLQPATTGFLGWFGPRGIASIIYGLLVLEETDLIHGEQIFDIAVIVVLISVMVHGLSAWPLVRWYGRHIAEFDTRPEHHDVPAIPLKHGNPVR